MASTTTLALRTNVGLAALAIFAMGFCQQTSTTQQPSPGQQTTPAPQQPLDPKAVQAEKQHQADIQNDIEVGKKAAAETEKEVKLSTNAEYQARVQRIGGDIAAIADVTKVKALWGDNRLNPFQYTYKVIKGDDVNAFSLPGGHVYVYEGLMKQVESDDELAGVLAHETAHAAFRHVAQLERDESRMMNFSLPLILAAILLGRGSAANVGVPGVQLMGQALASGWSVKAEEAADYGGLQYMEKSKYDPSGMLTFMERLAVDEKIGLNYNWGIYRDHPPGRERAEALEHYIEGAGIPIRRSKVTTSFRVTMKPGDHGNVALYFGTKGLVSLGGPDAIKRADAAVDTLNQFFDSTPEMFELQAGSDGRVLYRGRTLLQLTPEDSAVGDDRLDSPQVEALKNMRAALFNLGFHVWASHD
jgi:predicted Zn-dependent protease